MTKYLFLTIISLFIFIPSIAYGATEFVSSIQQSGGDYSTLATWEAAIQSDLTATTTRVFSGTWAGGLRQGNSVTCVSGGIHNGITATVVATTTAGQILLKNATSSEEVVLSAGDLWQKDANNYWTVSAAGTGDTAIAIAKIDGAWTAADTMYVYIDGWTTSASNYIKVYTTTAARHTGKWDTGKYRLEPTDAAIFVYEQYVRIEGLQIQIGEPGYSSERHGVNILSVGNGSDVRVSYCIIKPENNNVSSASYGINGSYNTSITNGIIRAWNNIIYNSPNTNNLNGIQNYEIDNTLYVYNNTCYRCRIGYYIFGGTVVAKNNIVQNCADGFNGAFNAASRNNISNIAGDTASSTADFHGRKVSFVNAAGADFHLAGNDSNARNNGVDLSADTNLAFSDDIDGQTRGYRGWDIGADETFASVQVGTPANYSGMGLNAGLVGSWTFNGADMNWASTTAEALDRSGNNNNGNAVSMDNKTAVKAGIDGQALSFDKVNDYVAVTSDIGLDDLGPMTVSAWVYPRSYGENATGYIVAKNVGLDGSNSWAIYLSASNGKLYFFRDYSTTNLYLSAPVVSLNQWKFITLTWNGGPTGATDVEIYYNGIKQNNTVVTNGSGSKPSDAANALFIGNDYYSTYTFDGLIDEVRVYNRVLSGEEVRKLYEMGARKLFVNTPANYSGMGLDNGLVGSWTFNGQDMNWGSTTAEALDRSGNGNNGNAVSIDSKTAVKSGIDGQALNFDKMNDYVAVTSDIGLDDLGPMTVSAWVYPKSSGQNGMGVIVYKDRQASITDGSWNLHMGSNFIVFQKGYDSTVLYRGSSVGSITFNAWHHILITWDGSATAANVHIYKNGVETGYSLTTNGVGNKLSDANKNSYIGNNVWNSQTFDGLIDEVRVYNRVLSGEEVRKLYEMGRRRFYGQ